MLLAIFALAAGYAQADAGDARRFALRVNAERTAASYDVTFSHGRLMQEDGRDILVLAPDGKPASHLLSFTDEAQCRVVFDGSAGPGTYVIRFGDLSTNLPPASSGVSDTGRKDWAPTGGFSSVAYRCGDFDVKRRIKDASSTVDALREIAEAATVAEKTEEQKQPDAAKRNASVRKTVDRVFGRPMPDRWAAIARAEVQIAQAGDYEFTSEGDRNYFRVLFIDGDHGKAVIPGWYGKGGQHTEQLSDWTGKASLTAGRHVFELYTSLQTPDLRMKPASDAGQIVPLTGHDAFYDACKVEAGAIEAADGSLADAAVATVNDWLALGRFANARQVCKAFRPRLAAEPEQLEKLNAAAEKALNAAYQDDWLTESKYPNRSGAMPEAVFAPPFRLDRVHAPQLIHNRAWRSSAVWTEGRLIHGVPWEVQDIPWGFTSALCVSDNTLYAGTKNGIMMAISISTGKTRWSFPAGANCTGCPLVYRDALFFGGIDRRLYALDAANGRMLWNYPAKGWIEGSVCADGGLVFFGARDGFLYAVDARLGVERWKTALGAPIVGTPSTDGKAVFVGDRNGDFVGVAAADGKVLWKYAAGAPILGGSCVSGGKVSFGDGNGRLHSLATDTGKLTWTQPTDVGGPVAAAPILVGQVLYGGTVNRICWGVKADDGSLVWKADDWDRDAHSGFTRPPLFADGRLFFIPENAPYLYQFSMAPRKP